MKKLLLLLFLIIFLFGCTSVPSTPRLKTEEFLMNYQKLSDEVIRDLDMTIVSAGVDENNYKVVRKAFKRQYKDLKYKIIKVKEDKKNAVVTAKINVYDYTKAKNTANKYIEENSKEFIVDNAINNVKIENFMYKECIKTKKRVNYIIKLKLYKYENTWKIKQMDEKAIEKIHGVSV